MACSPRSVVECAGNFLTCVDNESLLRLMMQIDICSENFRSRVRNGKPPQDDRGNARKRKLDVIMLCVN
jgi:hypothetical protein